MDVKMLNRARGTRVFTLRDEVVVRYHWTEVVKCNKDVIILNTGGYHTQTTKRRMNQASDVFGLGFRVYQEDYTWYAEYRGKTYRFHEGLLTLDRRGL